MNALTLACTVAGFFLAYYSFGTLMNLMKPNSVTSFLTIRPGEGEMAVLKFSLLLGIMTGLVPFLRKYISVQNTKIMWFYILLILAALTGSVLSFVYWKLKYLRAVKIMEQFELDSALRMPPLFLVPVSGIILMLVTFVVLRCIFSESNIS